MWTLWLMAAAVAAAMGWRAGVHGARRPAARRVPARNALPEINSLERRLARGRLTAAEFRRLRAMADAVGVDRGGR